MKIRKGDKVKLIYGKDRGRISTVEKAFPKKNQVIVAGVNVYKKHVKPRGEQKGGIIDLVKPLGISKVMLVCPKCDQATRVGYEFEGGKKFRVCKKCHQRV